MFCIGFYLLRSLAGTYPEPVLTRDAASGRAYLPMNTFLTTLAAIALAGSAHAATFAPSSSAAFDAECGTCEIITPTVRAGNRAVNGDWEVAISDTGLDQKQLPWVSGAGYGYGLTYVAATGMLTLELGSVSSATMIDLGAANTIYLRTRAEPGGTTAFSGPGFSLANDGTSADKSEWLKVTDFKDGDGNFSLSGTMSFDFGTALKKNGSNFIVQAKIADVAPVPLPAAGLLLVGALGAMGALRRREG